MANGCFIIGGNGRLNTTTKYKTFYLPDEWTCKIDEIGARPNCQYRPLSKQSILKNYFLIW